MLVALTLQYQVLPKSSESLTLNVIPVTLNPEFVQLVAIIKSGELNSFVVSISTDQPPTPVFAAEYDQVSWGVSTGDGLIPVSTDQEPFRGATKTGSDGIASEPGTYTKETSGLFAELTLLG